jgi:hypothetical protein
MSSEERGARTEPLAVFAGRQGEGEQLEEHVVVRKFVIEPPPKRPQHYHLPCPLCKLPTRASIHMHACPNTHAHARAEKHNHIQHTSTHNAAPQRESRAVKEETPSKRQEGDRKVSAHLLTLPGAALGQTDASEQGSGWQDAAKA